MATGLFGYMFIEGEKQGKIEGSCEREEVKGAIQVLQMEHDVTVNYDKFNRMAKSESQHDAIKLCKEWDKSSPKLAKALFKGEHLKKVEIKWFRTDRQGKYAHFYTHLMEDAHIVAINTRLHNVNDPQKLDVPAHMEEVAIAYGKMV